MATLPTVGGDNNTWGTELNTWALIGHNADGTHKDQFVNLGDYCAIDGVTDDSTNFGTAYTLASSLGTGLWHPGGTLLKGNHTLLPNVPIEGVAPGVSIFKLKNGANSDLFNAQTGNINLSASYQSGSNGTLSNFTLRNLTLDGNKVGQASGPSYPLRFYGYAYLLQNLEVKNGYSGGVLCDWNGPLGYGMEATIENVWIHDCNGIGWQMGGPHDSRLRNVLSWLNSSHGFHFAPNTPGLLCENIHPYALTQSVTAVGCLCEANSCAFLNCMFEGSDAVQFANIAADTSILGGMIFGVPGWAGVGLQMGQAAGQTPIPGQIRQSGGVTTAAQATRSHIDTKINDCTSGAINFWNETANTVSARIYQTSGTALVSNRWPSAAGVTHMTIGGLADDGTLNTLDQFHTTGFLSIGTDPNTAYQAVIKPHSDAQRGLVVYANSASNASSMVEVQDETYVAKFTIDRTGAMKLQGASTFLSGSGAPGSSLGAIGDYYFRSGTPGTTNQRIYIKTGASTWTGIV